MDKESLSDNNQYVVAPIVEAKKYTHIGFPLVYLIVLNWNGLEDTDECLDSLLKISYPNYVVVVIDNGSKINEARIIEDKYRGLIKTIRNHINLGFVGGMNRGIRYSLKNDADYILLLNNDIIVDKEFLTELVDVAEVNPNAAMFGPKIYDYHNPRRYSPPLKIDYSKGMFHHLKMKQSLEDKKYRSVDWISGCAMMIRASVTSKVGYLDPNFRIYTNDIDYAERIRRAGYKVLWVPSAKIWHKLGASTKTVNNLYLKYDSFKNKLLFEKKYAKRKELLIFLFYFIFNLIPRFIIITFMRRPIDTLQMVFCLLSHRDFKPQMR